MARTLVSTLGVSVNSLCASVVNLFAPYLHRRDPEDSQSDTQRTTSNEVVPMRGFVTEETLELTCERKSHVNGFRSGWK